MQSGKRYVSVYITAGSEEEAVQLSRAAVKEKAAACANLFPIRSIYEWKGKVCDDSEWAVIMKTTEKRWPVLESIIREVHSYEVPCIVCWPIVDGYAPYLEWVSSAVGEEGDNVEEGGKEVMGR